MDFSLPVLVARGQREHAEVLLPGISTRRFKGTSLARLLDDAALYLMETVPKEAPRRLIRYAFNPLVELRRAKVVVTLPSSTKKEKDTWSGRISVVLSHWPGERFWVATIPRLSTELFAIESPGASASAVARILERKLEEGEAIALAALECRPEERLEILNFEADLPTLLPSQPIRRDKPKKKKKKAGEASAEPEPEKKRVLVSPQTLFEVGVSLTHRALDGRLNRAFLREALVKELV